MLTLTCHSHTPALSAYYTYNRNYLYFPTNPKKNTMVLRQVRVQKYYKLRLQSAINIYLPVLSANNLVPFSTWGYAVGIVCICVMSYMSICMHMYIHLYT